MPVGFRLLVRPTYARSVWIVTIQAWQGSPGIAAIGKSKNPFAGERSYGYDQQPFALIAFATAGPERRTYTGAIL